MFGKRGEESPIYGRYGKESNTFKEDAGYVAKHIWIRMYFPPEDVCENKCEICGKFRLDLELAQFIHNNKRNIEDPMIDYLYICPYNEENACHRIYDDNLFEKEKEELLTGAITREEKLKRVREYVMKIKKEVK